MGEKKLYKILFLCGALCIGGLKYYDYSKKVKTGYCFAEKRYLSKAEFYENAIEALYTQLNDEYLTFSSTEKEKVKHYSSPKIIKLENTKCCNENLKALSGQKGASRSNLINKYGYFSSGSIYLELDRSLEATLIDRTKKAKAAFTAKPCGEIRGVRIYNSDIYSENYYIKKYHPPFNIID